MPTDTIRASGNNQYGVMSDVDRANFNSAQNAQDFVLRKRLQDEALNRQLEMNAQNLSAEERMNQARINAGLQEGGTFAEKQAYETQLANIRNSPQMEALKQAAAMHAEERGDTAGQRALDAAKLKMQLGAYNQFDLPPGAPGAMDPTMRQRVMEHALGLGEDPNTAFQRGLGEKIAMVLAAKAAENGDLGDIGNIVTGAKTGDFSKVSKNIMPEPQALSLDDVKNNVAAQVGDFAKNATKMFGYNPTSDDMDAIVKSRDQLAEAIKGQNPRIDANKARSAANQIIDAQLLKSGAISTWAGGGQRTRELRQRLGIIPGDTGISSTTQTMPNAFPM